MLQLDRLDLCRSLICTQISFISSGFLTFFCMNYVFCLFLDTERKTGSLRPPTLRRSAHMKYFFLSYFENEILLYVASGSRYEVKG